MQGGDLRQAFARDELDEYAWHDRGRQIALDIARGLHFLHTSGVIHRCLLVCSNAVYGSWWRSRDASCGRRRLVTEHSLKCHCVEPSADKGELPCICRDLKTSNILLSAEGVAKIADVGLAKMLTNADQYSLDHTAGTFAYAAPELILGTRCSEKVNVMPEMQAQQTWLIAATTT